MAAVSNRSKLIGALGVTVVIAIACGDDGKSPTNNNPDNGNGGATALASGVAGKACTTDTECGSGATCNNTQGFGTLGALGSIFGIEDLPAPGGHCSAPCTTDAQCGEGGACLGAALGILQGECRKKCSANTDCRDGYECAIQAEVSSDAGVPSQIANMRLPSQCQAKPKPDVLTAGQAGTPCDDEQDAGTPVCGDGFCPAGGGSCSGICSEDSTCGAGAVCVSNGFYGTTGYCAQSCSVDTDCKSYRANGNVGCVESGARKVCGLKQYPLAPGAAGKGCTADSACGTTGRCLETLGLPQVEAPGGYCSVTGCQDDSVCGGGACIGVALASACYATCTSDASCREGYTCQSQRSIARVDTNVCVPSEGAAAPRDAGTTPAPDAGTPAASADAG